MEEKQYQDYHLPFAQSRLLKTSEFLKNILEPASHYHKPVRSQELAGQLFSKILGIGEDIVGPTYSLQKGGIDFPLPMKWFFIINYLKAEGLIDSISFRTVYYDEPKIFKTQIFSSLDRNLTDGRSPRRTYTHGDSLDLEEAISKVIGEFLERFPLTIYREKNFLRASFNDLRNKNKDYLDINCLAGFSEEQKERNAYFRFDKKSNFLWTEGKSLLTNKKILMPAQLIFWNYNIVHQDWREPLLRETNTNGAAGHFTLTKAILAGLYELIQRDGFLIYWLNKQAPPQIDIQSITAEPLKSLLEECQHLGLEIHFYNTTTEIGVPSCICTVLDQSGIGPSVAMGAGCDMNCAKMLLRSLTEALSVFHWLRSVKETQEEDFPCIDKDYRVFQDYSINQSARLSLWANQKMFDHFQFFLKGQKESLKELEKRFPQFFSPEEELDYLIKKFKSLGHDYEIFYYQAQHKILKDLDYCSVKVIVPALVSLYLNEPHVPLGANRLKEVPEKLGFKPAKKWNPWPHPFP